MRLLPLNTDLDTLPYTRSEKLDTYHLSIS